MVPGPAAIGVRSLDTVEVGFAYGPHRHTNTQLKAPRCQNPPGNRPEVEQDEVQDAVRRRKKKKDPNSKDV